MNLAVKRPTNTLLSLPETQSLLGVKSRKTILKYIRSGKLLTYKIGGTRWRIALEDIVTFLKQEQVQNGNDKKDNGEAIHNGDHQPGSQQV